MQGMRWPKLGFDGTGHHHILHCSTLRYRARTAGGAGKWLPHLDYDDVSEALTIRRVLF